MPNKPNHLDIIGKQINFLKVEKYLYKRRRWHVYQCRCVCGKITYPLRQSLIKKNPVVSCGCKTIPIKGKENGNYKHGKSTSSIYWRYKAMMRRCYNPKTKKYPRYGGRGIIVCECWHEFNNFYADMGDPLSPEMSLDRIDLNGDYCKENCRWATQKTQQNNRVNTIWLTVDGETKRLTEWAAIVNIPRAIIHQRITRDKWPVKKALGKTNES